MFSKELFGRRVQTVRSLHEETQKNLGDAIGMSANNVSEIESGKRPRFPRKLRGFAATTTFPPTTSWACPTTPGGL